MTDKICSVWLSPEAYALLESVREPHESDSDTIARLARFYKAAMEPRR